MKVTEGPPNNDASIESVCHCHGIVFTPSIHLHEEVIKQLHEGDNFRRCRSSYHNHIHVILDIVFR